MAAVVLKKSEDVCHSLGDAFILLLLTQAVGIATGTK